MEVLKKPVRSMTFLLPKGENMKKSTPYHFWRQYYVVTDPTSLVKASIKNLAHLFYKIPFRHPAD